LLPCSDFLAVFNRLKPRGTRRDLHYAPRPPYAPFRTEAELMAGSFYLFGKLLGNRLEGFLLTVSGRSFDNPAAKATRSLTKLEHVRCGLHWHR
jgi:hypothetical protein